MSYPKTLQSTAYHEAGHAVMCWHTEIKISSVTIVESKDSLGHVAHANPLKGIDLAYDGGTRARMRMEKLVLVSLAGPLAQRKFNPKGYRHCGAEDDHKNAFELLDYFSRSTEVVEAYFKFLEARAKEIIDYPDLWYVVKSLAEKLLDKNTLKGHEVRSVILDSRERRRAEHVEQREVNIRRD